jgi:hypothetical protein
LIAIDIITGQGLRSPSINGTIQTSVLDMLAAYHFRHLGARLHVTNAGVISMPFENFVRWRRFCARENVLLQNLVHPH